MSFEHGPKRARLEQPPATRVPPVAMEQQDNDDTILHVIYGNFARGTLRIDPSWNHLDDDTVKDLFQELRQNERDKQTASLSRLIVQQGDIREGVLFFLLEFLRNVKTPALQVLRMSGQAVWLLPALLRLRRKLHTLELHDPVVDPNEGWWTFLHDVLQVKSKHMRIIRIECTTTTTTTEEEDDEMMKDDDDDADTAMIPSFNESPNPWLALLLKLPLLEEYHQVGNGAQRWKPSDVYHLMLHPSLENVTLNVDLSEGGGWPSSGLRALMRLPKRENFMRVALPKLSSQERLCLSTIVPVRLKSCIFYSYSYYGKEVFGSGSDSF